LQDGDVLGLQSLEQGKEIIEHFSNWIGIDFHVDLIAVRFTTKEPACQALDQPNCRQHSLACGMPDKLVDGWIRAGWNWFLLGA
jgi:hypothetical protein